MREIKFRGYSQECQRWVYGYYYGGFNWADFIIEDAGFENRVQVIPSTVGQFTGLLDKNGKEIYEGDVLRMWLEDVVEPKGGVFYEMWVVFTTKKGFILWGRNMTIGDAEPLHDTLEWKECEIIGTAYDSYELKK